MPLVAVTIGLNVPVGVATEVDSVNIVEPALKIVAGENDAVVLAGRPLMANVTVPAKPFWAVVVTV